MINLQLFRIKVFPTRQLKLFSGQQDPRIILRDTINSIPEAELREGIFWHIGNLNEVDKNSFYFRLGRTTKSTIEVYRNGNFRDEEFETAPYTHIILDYTLEICAIAKKSKLSPTTVGIANQFQKLLNESKYAQSVGAEYEVGEINDPTELITYIEQATEITKFWVNFGKPNAFDADLDFVKPLQRIVKETNGESGRTELKGKSLNPELLKKITKSAARTADDAAATMYDVQTGKKVTKRLKGNSINFSEEDLIDKEQIRKTVEKMRDLYRGIR